MDCLGVALAEAFKLNATLISVHLSFNAIGDSGAVALTEAFKLCAFPSAGGVHWTAGYWSSRDAAP